jgi:predicted ester cyclase
MSHLDKETLRRIPLEAFNEGKVEIVDEVLAADFTEHGSLPPGVPQGRDGLKALIKGLKTAFPDMRYTMIHEVAEGDMVVQHMRISGTMKGEFAGMKPTGKSATWDEVHIVRMKDGKAVEHWASTDQLGMLEQLGLAPAVPVARAA